jgi:phosphate starvation-inducible PhoH-like protein
MARRKNTDDLPPEAKLSLAEPIRGKTKGQSEYLRTMISNSVTFCCGDSGTGKSYLSAGLACEHLLENKCSKIIVCRPAIESKGRQGSGLGFIKGDISEKLGPYMAGTVEHFKRFLGKDRFYKLYHEETIQFLALEYMRGLTFNDSFVICEEFQNATKDQLIMTVTRIGEGSKIVISGDYSQTDLKKNTDVTDFEWMMTKIENANLDGFGVCRLGKNDIIRSPLIGPFLNLISP